MTETAITGQLTRETFLAELVEGLVAVLETVLGPQIATSSIGDVGLAVGVRVDRDLKTSLGTDQNLSMDAYSSLIEGLLRNLYADAKIVEATGEKLSVEVYGSAFRHLFVKGREFSDIGASIFGAIAAVNFGFGKICMTPSAGHDGVQRITIFTADTPEAREMHGEEYYGEVVKAFGNVQTQLKVVEENRLIREQLQESAVEYRERHRQISAVAAIATTVSQSRDPTEILTAGLRMLVDAVSVEVGAIYTVDEDTGLLTLTHQYGLSPEEANEVLFDHVLPQQAPPGRERWEGILSTRRHSPPDWSFGKFQCYASAPMQAKERRLGVVLVLARLRQAFMPLEMELLELVANELGVGMENIRLYRNLSRQVDRVSNLRDISAELNRCSRLDQVLDLAAESVTKKLGFDRVGIFLVNEQANCLERMRGTDEYGHLLHTDDRQPVPISPDHGTLARSVIERRPLHALDVASEAGLELGSEEAVGLANLRISAFARVPLIAEGKVVGAISVDNMLHRKAITNEDLHMLMIFGNQVAVAIDNVRFTETLERSTEELRKVDAVRSEFVGMISHELRSPLHKIRNAGTILLDGETDRDRAKYARLIVRSTDYLTGLVNNLLAQARVEGAALR
nr:GAF domain-containing protein [Armatimonadota bacterium]